MKLSSVEKVIIETYDNPGWGISIYFKDVISTERKQIKAEHTSDKDWLSIFMEPNSMGFNGDDKKLGSLFTEIMAYVDFTCISNIDEILELLGFFQRWYTNECNGDWEHLYGMSGEINFNGQLHLVIDLDETYWQDEEFQQTGCCQKVDHQFMIDCDKESIVACLNVFKNWIESV